MRLRLRLLVPLLFALAACADDPTDPAPDAAARLADPTPTPAAAPAAPPAFAPGEVIVKLRAAYDGAAPIELAGRRLIPIKQLPSGAWLMTVDDRGARVADVAAATLAAVDQLAADPAVETAYPNLAFELSTTPNDPEADPFSGRQGWALGQIHMYDAWTRTQGSPSIRIALIDSGRREHPELAGRWDPGYDFINNDSDPTDDPATHLGVDWAHGIHVAGIVGANANNATGGAGICWTCRLIPLRVTPRFTTAINPGGIAYIAELEQAVNWAAGPDSGPIRAEVINFSLNHPTLSDCNDPSLTNLRTEISRAIARGVVVVSSAGNLTGTNPAPLSPRPRVPATCPGVISVMATDANIGVPGYSARGFGADLVAPGGGPDLDQHYGDGVGCPTAIQGNGTNGVFSTWSYRVGPSDAHCYRHLSGTSMSAPHVTGTVALMRAVRALTPAQIKAVLRLTASPPSPPWGLICPEPNGCGAGLVDANAAVDAVDSGSPVIAEISPNQHDFGSVSASAPGLRTFVLHNIGFAPLTVSAGDPMFLDAGSWFSFAYTSGACTSGQTCARAISLPVNATSNIPIRCTPTGTGTQTAELVIPSNSVGQIRVQLWCTSSGAPVLSAPSGFGFGDVRLGNTTSAPIAITNNGTAPLTVNGATVTGTGFGRLGGLPPTIAAGGTGTVTVSFTPPTATTPFTGSLVLTSDGGSATVQLTGRGVAAILSAPPGLGFGDVRVNTTATAQVTITNGGSASLTVTAANVTGTGFARVGGPPPTIAAGGTGTITVSFTPPTATTVFAGNLAITSDGGSANVALSGRGVAPVLGAPALLAFGDVRVGALRDLNVVVSNGGTAPLSVTNAIVTGVGFSRTSALPGPISVAGNASITVRCAPTAPISYSGTLTVISDGGNATVQLTCRGVTPVLAVSSTTMPFGDVRVGTAATDLVGISNTGTAPLTITTLTVGPAPFSLFFAIPTPAVVMPNETLLAYVTCAPTATGVFAGTLALTSDAGSASVALTCRGTAPNLSTSASIGFPDALLGSTTTAATTIFNTGTAALTITGVTLTGADFGLDTAVPSTIAAGGRADLTLHCHPTTAGFKTGTLTLIHDGAASPTTIALGCNASAGRVEIVQPANGQVELVPFVPQQVTIRNSGVGPLHLDALELSDDHFSTGGVTLPATIEAGATLSWTVSCESGKWLGTYTAKLAAKHDGVDANTSLFSLQCSYTFAPL